MYLQCGGAPYSFRNNDLSVDYTSRMEHLRNAAFAPLWLPRSQPPHCRRGKRQLLVIWDQAAKWDYERWTAASNSSLLSNIRYRSSLPSIPASGKRAKSKSTALAFDFNMETSRLSFLFWPDKIS